MVCFLELAIIRVAGLLQSVSRGAAKCVQGYKVCAAVCSFDILPCSSRLSQKIFYIKKIFYEFVSTRSKRSIDAKREI